MHLDVLEQDVWVPIERKFEVHLMVERPEEIVERWVERGASGIIVHKLSEKLLEYKRKGIQIGLGVEMQVPLEEVYPKVDEVNFVHMMSIEEIGEQGHPLSERVFDRIRALREKFPFKTISVDGGINAGNYQKFVELGVDRLVVGSGFDELWTSLTKKQ